MKWVIFSQEPVPNSGSKAILRRYTVDDDGDRRLVDEALDELYSKGQKVIRVEAEEPVSRIRRR